MCSEIISYPDKNQKAGFTQRQFRMLDALYLQAASHKTLTYRTVECDFDEGVASYTYYISEGRAPYLQFIIRKVGPRTMMYELFKYGKGRVAKSGVFEKTYERLMEEIDDLLGI